MSMWWDRLCPPAASHGIASFLLGGDGNLLVKPAEFCLHPVQPVVDGSQDPEPLSRCDLWVVQDRVAGPLIRGAQGMLVATIPCKHPLLLGWRQALKLGQLDDKLFRRRSTIRTSNERQENTPMAPSLRNQLPCAALATSSHRSQILSRCA